MLTSYGGKTITYDAVGNPLSDGTRSYTWEQGRQLKSMSKSGTTWTYTYGPDGMRTSRSNGTTTWNYVYNGSQLMAMLGTNGISMYFAYDAAGRPVSIEYNGTTYYYVLNAQGDVVTIVNSSGSSVVNYTYNAWGKLCRTTGSMTSSLGHHNPLRYRGYVYDTDTGLYYLQSRYYNPEMGRFLNADSYASTGQGILGNNMFAYCGNNPVNRVDPSGSSWLLVGLIIIGIITLTSCSSNTQPRADLANAPNLDISAADPTSYNCYGNGIGKQIAANPTGYQQGDTVRKTFEAVKKDLGINNVRELDSINAPIGDDEFKVAMRCGPTDYHFIRLTSDGWYNKSGSIYGGVFIAENMVTADCWVPIGMVNGQVTLGPPMYFGEIIYFAVKVGWDKS